MKTEKEIKEAALNECADSVYPFNDKVDAFIAGAKWMQEQDNKKNCKCNVIHAECEKHDGLCDYCNQPLPNPPKEK